VTSGTPSSSRTVRQSLPKLFGSRNVPAVDGKMRSCSPRYGRARRSVSVSIANLGSGRVRRPEAVLVPSMLINPLPVSRTTLPVTVIVPRVRVEVAPAQTKQFRAAQAGRNQDGDRVDQIMVAAVIRRALLGQQFPQLVARQSGRPPGRFIGLDRRHIAYR